MSKNTQAGLSTFLIVAGLACMGVNAFAGSFAVIVGAIGAWHAIKP